MRWWDEYLINVSQGPLTMCALAAGEVMQGQHNDWEGRASAPCSSLNPLLKTLRSKKWNCQLCEHQNHYLKHVSWANYRLQGSLHVNNLFWMKSQQKQKTVDNLKSRNQYDGQVWSLSYWLGELGRCETGTVNRVTSEDTKVPVNTLSRRGSQGNFPRRRLIGITKEYVQDLGQRRTRIGIVLRWSLSLYPISSEAYILLRDMGSLFTGMPTTILKIGLSDMIRLYKLFMIKVYPYIIVNSEL